MIKEAMEHIESRAGIQLIEIDGVQFAREQLYMVKADQEPPVKTLELSTLSGLIDYIKARPDNTFNYLVHVEDFRSVSVYGELEKQFGRRKHYVTANADMIDFRFDSFYGQEEMIIKLQSQFVRDDALLDVLKVVGNVSLNHNVEQKDDGYSQEVTARTGVARMANIDLPNPVTLVPRRTFPEIDQVSSQFVLRARQSGEFALFQADGNLWKVQTIHEIRDYLVKNLENENVLVIA